MAKQKSKMICPKCGNEMNHHADKLVYPVTAEDAGDDNATLGGLSKKPTLVPDAEGWSPGGRSEPGVIFPRLDPVLSLPAQRLQHRPGVADFKLARRFDIDRLNHAVVHQHGEALRRMPMPRAVRSFSSPSFFT